MDSQLLHSTTSFLKGKAHWQQEGESEWIDFGQGESRTFKLVFGHIEEHFSQNGPFLVRGQTNSKRLSEKQVLDALQRLAGVEDFEFWNRELNVVMEFRSAGSFRIGKVE